MHHEMMDEAGPGDNVGLSVRGFGKKDVQRGEDRQSAPLLSGWFAG